MSLEVVRYLAETIGPRPAGSGAEHRAAEYVAGLFEGLGLNVTRQTFRYIGWRPLGQVELEVLEPVQVMLYPAPMPWTESTPPEGVVGRLQPGGTAYLIPGVYEWPKFEIVDGAGQPLGEVVAYPDGPAIPFPSDAAFFLSPGVVVGQEELMRFQDWLSSGQHITVRLTNPCEYVPGFESTNVIATLPGETSDELIICAHHDTAYGCPGAEDNGSGVEALMRVARALIGQSLRLSIRCISFAGEEWVTFGSRYCARRLRERGELERVKGIINLDMVGAGEFAWLFYGPETLRPRLESAVEASGLADQLPVTYDHPRGPSSDHWPFYELGVPCVFFLLWPYPPYHLPDDVPAHVSEDKVEMVARAVVHLASNWRD